MLGDKAASLAMKRCCVRDLLYPTHRAIVGEFDWLTLTEYGYALARPPKVVLSQDRRVNLERTFADVTLQQLTEAKGDHALCIWNKVVTNAMAAATGEKVERGFPKVGMETQVPDYGQERQAR
jgi:hypothetical protein